MAPTRPTLTIGEQLERLAREWEDPPFAQIDRGVDHTPAREVFAPRCLTQDIEPRHA